MTNTTDYFKNYTLYALLRSMAMEMGAAPTLPKQLLTPHSV
jgi:hypothetical protein